MRGKLFVISGPSGAGKGSIVEKLLAGGRKIYFSVSATTREKRAYEKEGREYYFVSREEFRDRIDKGRMLEWRSTKASITARLPILWMRCWTGDTT